MSKLRPVVNSDGEKFSTISAAADFMFMQSNSSIHRAIRGTENGIYSTAGGLQWDYAEHAESWPNSWPEKLVRSKKSKPRVIQLMECRDTLIFPPEFDEETWRPVFGLVGYEVSTECRVRDEKLKENLKKLFRGGMAFVEIGSYYYKCFDLMLLAFIGPKPHGYAVHKRVGTSEKLSNAFYGPRKPRNSK